MACHPIDLVHQTMRHEEPVADSIEQLVTLPKRVGCVAMGMGVIETLENTQVAEWNRPPDVVEIVERIGRGGGPTSQRSPQLVKRVPKQGVLAKEGPHHSPCVPRIFTLDLELTDRLVDRAGIGKAGR